MNTSIFVTNDKIRNAPTFIKIITWREQNQKCTPTTVNIQSCNIFIIPCM